MIDFTNKDKMGGLGFLSNFTVEARGARKGLKVLVTIGG